MDLDRDISLRIWPSSFPYKRPAALVGVVVRRLELEVAQRPGLPQYLQRHYHRRRIIQVEALLAPVEGLTPLLVHPTTERA